MYMAINEDEIIEKIMRGHATPAAQVPDPPTIGYNENIQRLPYDPEMAKNLLKEAGYENGFDITLTGPNDRYVQDAKIAEAVARYLFFNDTATTEIYTLTLHDALPIFDRFH